jgi:acetyl/propionyl-CoA carboxylase alpha subunit/acetyl-CoA carboxylase carboxyltransferase component
MRRLLIANRGEIAVRILRAATELGIESIAIAPEDDAAGLHMQHATRAVVLPGRGAAAYLDVEALVRIACEHSCDALHPGYGFLSESPALARACADARVAFVGPTPEQLALLGDKGAARALAARCGVPVTRGTDGAATLETVRHFMRTLGAPVMIKAVYGGGGRGMRLVDSIADLETAYERCRSEAARAFGDERVYAEAALPAVRHIEVQIVGDGGASPIALGERDCSLQRRHQKLVEVTPSPALEPATRERLLDAALRMAAEIRYSSVATFEFLVPMAATAQPFYFLEANPRLQVEHTITEELWNVDLVATQLCIASGASIADLGLAGARPRRGFALQLRINAERIEADGTVSMPGGTLTAFEPSHGPGIRVDTAGHRGMRLNAGFDSLLAKLVVRTDSADIAIVLRKARRALDDFVVEGTTTNAGLLGAILDDPEVQSMRASTRFVDERLAVLLARAATNDGSASESPAPDDESLATNEVAVRSPLTGVVIELTAEAGSLVAHGQTLAIVESMKMEHVVVAPSDGTLVSWRVARGSAVQAGTLLACLAGPGAPASASSRAPDSGDPAVPRADLEELAERQRRARDAARPDAVEHRHRRGFRTARENVTALCDPDSFVEYGALVVAAQRRRRTPEELIARTPADGMIAGFGDVNGALFGRDAAQSLVIAFDETVLAGTMGEMAREKLKRVLAVAHDARRPVVLFAEGGGGRAGDTDNRVSVTGWTLDVSCYHQFARLSGLVPLVGIANGLCFAANAGMLSICDVIIATRRSNLGAGGPTMIEGGRLGQFKPEDIGPVDVHVANGVVDVLVEDEVQAVEVTRRYLAFCQGALSRWEAPDVLAARRAVPEHRLRAYDVRDVLATIADRDSVLELRAGFGLGMVTALARVEGRPLGILANNPKHLGGAIDTNAADKAARFMMLCEGYGLPILTLCDTPGVMVGPEAEKTGTLRRMGRMFIIGANLKVPLITIVLRKAYGIGAELMAGGWFKAPRFVVSWPTGEFGGMNLEGNVKLANAKELDAIADPAARRARFEELVALMHAEGKALSVATHFEVDDVIDPADSRRWIASALANHRGRRLSDERRLPFIDPW